LSASILLVDDDMSVRRSLVRLLRAHGYEVIEVDNVARAVEILTTQLPAVMLMDMVMPGQDSLDVVRAIKREPLTAALPIIALTASPPSAPQDRALFAGIMLKPADARALLETIGATLGSTATARLQI
jgi:CheY-like chemotaxis protein